MIMENSMSENMNGKWKKNSKLRVHNYNQFYINFSFYFSHFISPRVFALSLSLSFLFFYVRFSLSNAAAATDDKANVLLTI